MIIYKTTNNLNSKIYVGQSTKNDPNYYGSGKLISYVIKKYGIENFTREILCECSSLEELNEKEIFWIKELNAMDKNIGYNLHPGGNFGDMSKCENFQIEMKSEHHRKKMGDIKREFYANNPKEKEKTGIAIKTSIAHQTVVKSEAYRNKMREIKTNPSDEIRKKMSEGRKKSEKCRGPWTEEIKEKGRITRALNKLKNLKH